MRKLKGITINGEWLGDNVIINANFRAICNLAPFIMQEFAKLINSIDELDSAVAINNFYFPDNNTIDIEFSNQEFEGSANLNFKLEAGVPELVNRQLTIYTDEIQAPESIQSNDAEQEVYTENIAQNDLIENESVEEVKSLDAPIVEKEQEDIVLNDEVEQGEILAVDIDEIYENDEFRDTETSFETQEVIQDVMQNETQEEKQCSEQEVTNEQKETVKVDGGLIAQALASAIKDLPFTNKSEVVENIQKNNEEIKKQELNVNELDNEFTSANTTENAQIELEEDLVAKQQDCNKEISKSVDLQQNTQQNDNIQEIISENKNDEIISDDFATLNTDKSEQNDFHLQEQMNELSASTEQNIEAEQIQEPAEVLEFSGQEELTPEQNEEIQDCLADFYENVVPEEKQKDYEIEFDKSAVASLLDEIMNLKEELNKTKEENQRQKIDDILDSIGKKNNCCNDTYLDFNIMSSDERINANAVDKELFIAGDKLYKWGDTLYLNE